jgi:Family of unknown function (DUF6353)
MPSLVPILRSAVAGVKHNSPIILTGLAVGGVVTTAVLAVRATPKAIRILEDSTLSWQKDGEPMVKNRRLETLRLVWPLYIPAALTGAATIAAIIGAQSINSRRQAALIGAFTITEGAFQEYREQVTEALGKTKEKAVHEKIVQKHVDENPPTDFVVMGAGNVLCFDVYTGRYFESTMEKIRKAQNDFNEMLEGDIYLALNEFYTILGLDEALVGEQMGFASENRLKIEFDSGVAPDGRPYLAMSYRALPRQDYTAMFQ